VEEKKVPLKENDQETVIIDGIEYEIRPNGGLVSKKKAFADEDTYVGPNDRIEQGVHLRCLRTCLTEEEIREKLNKKENAMIEKIDTLVDDLMKIL
jgi:hypothetical protein